MESKMSDFRQRFNEMRQNWNELKATKTAVFWIAVGTVILTMYVGFARAGWMTDGTAEKQAETRAQTAVIARLAPICVAQFDLDPQKDDKLVEFQDLNTSTQRANFVIAQGWATMPDELTPDSKVASECANQIKSMDE
jgi:hypothetical protein